MQHLVDDVRGAVAAGNYYAALGLSLALPDICGRLETPNVGSTARSVRWLTQHLQPVYTSTIGAQRITHVFMSGEDCYALRCAYLHEGDLDISGQRVRDALDRFHFVVSPPGTLLHRNQNGKILLLDVSAFCDDVCVAVEKWIPTVPPEVATRMSALPKIERPDFSKGFSF